MGLTPPPLPPAMIPSKGRSLHEILRDKKVPEKDKMSSEIDDMVAKANPGEYLLTSASGSTTSASTSPYIQAAFSEISKSDEVPRTLPWDVADMRPRDGRSPYGWSAYNRGSGGSGGNPSVVDGNTYGTSPKHDK
ncbi:hypothetical protein F4780DRAFT_158691 [Xylariomycetidae sp. FL0641]|nr:hypothetical protein F4780DRAFT_158691 [Xylariomycetidae sp. FL0641]